MRMPKTYFHNNKLANNEIKRENLSNFNNSNKKQIVDVNKLLNRVRVNEQNEKKKKFILLGVSILFLSVIGKFLSVI